MPLSLQKLAFFCIADPNINLPGGMAERVSDPQVNQTITFAAGEVSSTVNITFEIRNDSIAELEAFNLILSSPSDFRVQIGGSLDAEFFATTEIKILDNKGKGVRPVPKLSDTAMHAIG